MKKIFAIAMLLAGTVQAASPNTIQQNIIRLSASGIVEVQQDLLRLNLTTSREDEDANVVQAQLNADLEAALVEAQKIAQPGRVKVHTGNFSLAPRYSHNRKVDGWRGTAELVLEGHDFGRIAQAISKIKTMVIGSVSFDLSLEQRAKAEDQAQAAAIEQFKVKAQKLAKDFGFSSYSLVEVSVGANDQTRPYYNQQDTSIISKRSVPVVAGTSMVVVTVSGSVKLK